MRILWSFCLNQAQFNIGMNFASVYLPKGERGREQLASLNDAPISNPSRNEDALASGAERPADSSESPLEIAVAAKGNSVASQDRSRWKDSSDPSLYSSFHDTDDYFQFAETFRSSAESGDADAQYLVAKSMLDCLGYHSSFRPAREDDAAVTEHLRQLRARANQRMDQLCGDFELDHSENSQELLRKGQEFLRRSAENGNPAAMANELVNEMGNALNSDDPELLANLDDWARDILASGDPYAVRKLSEYFSRSLRDHPLSLPDGNRLGANAWTTKLGFELAACSLGYPCNPESPMVLTACSQIGHACEPDWDYLQMHQMMIGPMPLDDARMIQQWVLRLIREGRLDELNRATE
jgi:hypothetical protein